MIKSCLNHPERLLVSPNFVVLYPQGVFPIHDRRQFFSLSQKKSYWMFPPIGGWQGALARRIREVDFILITCPSLFNQEELGKYLRPDMGKSIVYLCTSCLLNQSLPENDVSDLMDFKKWYQAQVDEDGAYFCTENDHLSFILMNNPFLMLRDEDYLGVFGKVTYQLYSKSETERINEFTFCKTVRSILFLERWPEPKTMVVMKCRRDSELEEYVFDSTRSDTYNLCRITGAKLRYFNKVLIKKSGFYINTEGHFMPHNNGRWIPEGEIVYQDPQGAIWSLLTLERIDTIKRLFLFRDNTPWVHIASMDISILKGFQCQMFDRIIFLEDRRAQYFTKEDHYTLSRCAKEVIVYTDWVRD